MTKFKPLDDVLETIHIEYEVKRLSSIAKKLDRRMKWSSRWRRVINGHLGELIVRRRELLDDLQEAR